MVRGVYGYELISAAIDPEHPSHKAAVGEFGRFYGNDIHPRVFGAGYLPPAHAAAATAELGLGKEWIGKGNRENQTMPVLHLRESATRMGLLRKHRSSCTAFSPM
jgi:hypothetical protein